MKIILIYAAIFLIIGCTVLATIHNFEKYEKGKQDGWIKTYEDKRNFWTS